MADVISSAAINMHKYRFLLKQLVTRDIKLKYRRSVLGYLWSVLNPLLNMIVLTIVFSHMTRNKIENFPVYLLCGSVLYTFFTTVTTGSCSAIIENAPLIKKVYLPKYIFVFSKVTSGFVDYLLSLIALIGVMLITRAHFSFYNLLFVIPVIEIYIFSMGLGLFLAQSNVFFRDISYLYSVFTTALMYLTPIFYHISMLPEKVQFAVVHLNPLYLYVEMFRQCVYSNSWIDPMMILYGFAWGLGTMLIGSICFKVNQDKFILYV